MPGDSLAIRNNALYINGEKQKDPARMQLCYFVETDGAMLTEEQFRKMDISKSDRKFVSVPTSDEEKFYYEYLPFLGFTSTNGRYNPIYRLPLTQEALEIMKKIRSVKQIKVEPEQLGGTTYPAGYRTGWTRDNYGPIWIPKKGATIELNERNLALYSRCIGSYEENTLDVRGGQVLINGQPATTYTFKYDYYWMMGDNRHNSADSRSWGFVPEDHIVGKPILIWLSLDKDRSLFNGGIRWSRMFRTVRAD